MSKNDLTIDRWLYCRQGDIINQFPKEHREGICYGLCLEYARYISKDRASRNTKDDDGTPKGFIKKLEAKFLENAATSNNLKKRLEQYQGYQFLTSASRDQIQSSNELSNDPINDIVELVEDDNVHELLIEGPEGSHAVAVHKIKDTGEYVIFDPNIGIKIVDTKEKFQTSLANLRNGYEDKHQLGSGANFTVTTNMSELIKNRDPTEGFLALAASQPTNTDPAPEPTPKYLKESTALFLKLRMQIEQGEVDKKAFDGITQDVLKLVDRDGNSLLHVAVIKGNIDAIEMLIAEGADLNAKHKAGLTPLHIAVRQGNKETVDLLLKKGADVNIADHNGETPLYYACYNNNTELATFLIEHEADVNIKDADDQTPLYIAVEQGNKETVDLLLKKGADVNIADHNGHTPLHIAVSNGNLNAVNALLSRQNVNVNLANKDGETPLHIASMKGHTDIASALIDKGAEVNAMDKDGETPLTYASRHNSAEAINILPEKGADLNVPDKDGETPLTYASQMGNLDTVKALVKSMGNYVKEIVGKVGKVAKSIFTPSIKNVSYILTGQFATNKTPKEDNVHPQGESEPVETVSSQVTKATEVTKVTQGIMNALSNMKNSRNITNSSNGGNNTRSPPQQQQSR